MQISHPNTAPDYYQQAGNLREGTRESSVLLTGEEGSPGNYRLGYGAGGEGDWKTPRHHHNFEQIRHPLVGDYSVAGETVLPAGWVGYFPEAAYYGPQVLRPNLELLVLQFGGPSGQGFASVQQRREGYDALLAKGGKFEKGMYTWTEKDGTRHNQDAFEAVWEQMNGRKITYPEARYDSIILMNPENFNWMKDADQTGVAHKWLGTFSERETRIGFIELDEGASLRFGTEPSPEILFVKEGVVSIAGASHERLTAIGSAKNEAPETITAREASELLYIKLPTF